MQQQAQSQSSDFRLAAAETLLNQQLATWTQAASHIHQLKQFLHQPAPNVPSPPPTPTIPQSSPEPPQPKAPPEGTSSTPTSFNPGEMITKLRDNFKEEMTNAFRKFQKSNQPPSIFSCSTSTCHSATITTSATCGSTIVPCPCHSCPTIFVN